MANSMTEMLRAKLQEAVTDEEARAALTSAINRLWGKARVNTPEAHLAWEADHILRGPHAGWLGVGVLMVPEGWNITHSWWGVTEATFTLGSKDRAQGWRDGRAKRPDCALVLAALKAKESDHG